jgi:hypothetical protein
MKITPEIIKNCYFCFRKRAMSGFGWLGKSLHEPNNLPIHLTAIFTLALAVFAAYAWKESKRGTEAIEGQLRVMRDQNRPWIRANITIARPIMFTDWAKSKFLNVPLLFELKNFGNIPAINIRVTTLVSPHPGNAAKQVLDASEGVACKQSRELADSDKIGGVASFPGESIAIESVAGTGPIYQDGQPTVFSVLGCIDYTYSDNRHGQTGFRKRLGRVEGNFVVGLPFVTGTPDTSGGPISAELLAKGYPQDPPIIGRLETSGLYFKDEDSGNYAE